MHITLKFKKKNVTFYHFSVVQLNRALDVAAGNTDVPTPLNYEEIYVK